MNEFVSELWTMPKNESSEGSSSLTYFLLPFYAVKHGNYSSKKYWCKNHITILHLIFPVSINAVFMFFRIILIKILFKLILYIYRLIVVYLDSTVNYIYIYYWFKTTTQCSASWIMLWTWGHRGLQNSLDSITQPDMIKSQLTWQQTHFTRPPHRLIGIRHVNTLYASLRTLSSEWTNGIYHLSPGKVTSNIFHGKCLINFLFNFPLSYAMNNFFR